MNKGPLIEQLAKEFLRAFNAGQPLELIAMALADKAYMAGYEDGFKDDRKFLKNWGVSI